jgi:hypothetical protein
VWSARLTNDLNALPPWQYRNGCDFGASVWLYTVIFHYDFGDQWTITVDRGEFEEMVFAKNGDPYRGGGATCVSTHTAARINRDLDEIFATHA